MQNLALISLFGVLGVLSRFGIDRFFGSWNEHFPASTLLINLLGSFMAGTIYALSENKFLSDGLQVALLVGFCGGFTTFSAYTLQTLTMIDRGKLIPAFSYLLISPVLGTLAAFFAVVVTRRLIL